MEFLAPFLKQPKHADLKYSTKFTKSKNGQKNGQKMV